MAPLTAKSSSRKAGLPYRRVMRSNSSVLAEMFLPRRVLESGFQGLLKIKCVASDMARAGARAACAIS